MPRKILILIFLFFLLLPALPRYCFSLPYADLKGRPVHAVPFSEDLVQRQKKRFEVAQMDKVCRVLGIKKNMVILDIGTGSGQYAYKFAEILQGTGEVFATDVDPDMVNYVKIEAEKKHLKNLTSVLVKADGVDDFYYRHKYDLIFIAHTLQYIPDHGNYLRKMKSCLSPQGHLVVLKNKKWSPFDSKCFTDVKGLLKQIVKEQPDSPFYQYLRPFQPEAKRILAGGALNQTFLTEIALCFNRMVRRGHFFVPFLDKKNMVLRDDVKIFPEERAFINIDLSFFKEFKIQDAQRGVDLKSPFLNSANYFIMRTINKILVISEFQEFMYGGKPPFLSGGDVNLEIETNKNDFKSFGYNLEQSYDFIPNEILMVFSPQD